MKPKAVLLDGESPQDSERLGLPQGSVSGVADSQSAPLPHAARVFAVLTRPKTKASTRPSPEVVEDAAPDEEEPRRPMNPLEYKAERWRRIRAHQEQDIYLSEIKSILKEYIGRFSPRRLRKISKVANLFALDARDVLYRLTRSTQGRPRDFVDETRLVIPDSLRSDMLHYAHEDFQGGHQGIARTPTTAQDVAEVYKECVFRRFGASSMVRHDQDPRFMSEAFPRFRKRLGSKQRATLAYRPQANGQQARSVKTVVRRIRAYIAEADLSDWDDHAERLMFALNTSFDATRLDTPFYLVHGLDAQGTLSAMLGPKRTKMHDDFRVKLEINDSGYRVNPWVHVSRFIPRALFQKRPTVEIEVAEGDDFDAALLPEDSWEPDYERNEYDVEKVLDLRWSKRARTSRCTREYLV
ncbi:unnamed protein product [Phytophthora fragariaefolia]|uniref:Unnamed protein product n=1 Tax=Phytophthora fragariaefolia TaxID=1490495 RepID=A0A9W6XYU6_9STRA|nr:unnamed protein product [Phytophthora fragariaefolia]